MNLNSETQPGACKPQASESTQASFELAGARARSRHRDWHLGAGGPEADSEAWLGRQSTQLSLAPASESASARERLRVQARGGAGLGHQVTLALEAAVLCAPVCHVTQGGSSRRACKSRRWAEALG
eukprot:2769342-Rhodomonas_salina.1